MSSESEKEFTADFCDMAVLDGNRLINEIVRLRERLAAVEAERDRLMEEKDAVFDNLFRTEQERDTLRDELTQQSITLSAEHQRAERILAALREPSEAVMLAAEEAMDAASARDCVPGDWSTSWVREGIRAAVAAAEQEVSNV